MPKYCISVEIWDVREGTQNNHDDDSYHGSRPPDATSCVPGCALMHCVLFHSRHNSSTETVIPPPPILQMRKQRLQEIKLSSHSTEVVSDSSRQAHIYTRETESRKPRAGAFLKASELLRTSIRTEAPNICTFIYSKPQCNNSFCGRWLKPLQKKKKKKGKERKGKGKATGNID